jgi:ribosome-associated toxin RatA of RatAB toxin-antitoxin module
MSIEANIECHGQPRSVDIPVHHGVWKHIASQWKFTEFYERYSNTLSLNMTWRGLAILMAFLINPAYSS